ncbi:ABC transporter substrate-binding protein [Gordonia rubripertincta]|uniref:ABC transporter substrate-binding protein n=1 Tax=Gordonia rubripertincta TaxID=36822 RepID=UPI000B8D3518|nr:ABC transporter substrate-binding protein [Gordonia rubripertincta]ASR03052.1 hypothetical protein GCWB2_11275 [Gordonia rubripertincta]
MRFASSRSRRRYAAACLGAVVVIAGATACTEDSSSEGGSSSAAAEGAVAAAPSGTFAGNQASGTPVKVGLINPEGGPAISLPEDRETAEAVVKYANENLAGIGGRPIELVECKSKEDPASATACANQMVEAGVVGVVVTNTAQGDVMVPILTGAKIPYTSYQGAGQTELTAPDYSYSWTGGFPEVLSGMAKYTAGSGMKDVTLYVTDSAAAINGAKAMGVPAFQAAGINLNVVAIPLGNPDASPQVSAGLKNNPQAVGIVGDPTMCTSVLKALGTVGTDAEKMVIGPCLDPSVMEAASAELNGSKVFNTAFGSGTDPESLTYQAIMAKYAPSVSPNGTAVTAYQSMLGFVRTAGTVKGDVTAASVNSAIRAAANVPLPVGDGLAMSCNGKAVPGLPMACSAGALVGTVDNGQITDVKQLN